MDYQKQGAEFAAKHGVKLEILSTEYRPYFTGDKESRYVYKCKLTRGRKSYTFTFGASISNPSEPTFYDLFACFQKYDPGDFENFCAEFGYDTDSRTAEKTYKAVCREYQALCRLFTPDELELMHEIN